MLVDRMCAITIDSETVQHRRSDGGGKISIRSASDLSFSQLIVERSSYTTRLLVKRHHFVGAFQWRAIDSAAHHKPHPIVNRAESQYLTLNSGAFLDSAKSQVNFGPSLSCYHIRERAPCNNTNVYADSCCRIIHCVQPFDLARDFQNSAGALFRLQARMSRPPPSFD